MEVFKNSSENPVLLPTSNGNEDEELTNVSINTCMNIEEVVLQDKVDSEASSAVIGEEAGEVMSILGLIGCHDSADDTDLHDESFHLKPPEVTSEFEAHFISEQQMLQVLHVEQVRVREGTCYCTSMSCTTDIL